MAQHIPLASGTRFQMGKGDSRHLVSPEIGATHLTMNYSIFQPGHEFPQHFHDVSADIFIVLEGGVSVRQGDSYVPIGVGEFAYIPAGEVHGTINQTDDQAILISFQSPPDPMLYRGERDPSVTGVEPRPPAGHVSQVQIRNLKSGDTEAFGQGTKWLSATPATGTKEMLLWYIELGPGEQAAVDATPESEVVWFVWSGETTITTQVDSGSPGAALTAGSRDVVFVPPGEAQTIHNSGENTVKLIRCQAPATT